MKANILIISFDTFLDECGLPKVNVFPAVSGSPKFIDFANDCDISGDSTTTIFGIGDAYADLLAADGFDINTVGF